MVFPEVSALGDDGVDDVLVTLDFIHAKVLTSDEHCDVEGLDASHCHVPLDLSLVVQRYLVIRHHLACDDFGFLRVAPLVNHEAICGLAFEADVRGKKASGFGCFLRLENGDAACYGGVDDRSVDVAAHPVVFTLGEHEVDLLDFHAGALAELLCNDVFKDRSPVSSLTGVLAGRLARLLFPEFERRLVGIEAEDRCDVRAADTLGALLEPFGATHCRGADCCHLIVLLKKERRL